MKLTIEQIKQIIKEELSEMASGDWYSDQDETFADMKYRYANQMEQDPNDNMLQVDPKPEGGWTVKGMFKGHKVNIDSDYKKYDADISEWDNSPRFAMARELTGFFYRTMGEEGMVVKEPMLKNTRIVINSK